MVLVWIAHNTLIHIKELINNNIVSNNHIYRILLNTNRQEKKKMHHSFSCRVEWCQLPDSNQ